MTFEEAARQHLAAVKEVMPQALDRAAELLLEEMRHLTLLVDHDLEQLREMDHPYSHRGTPGFPHDDWLVHIQSGELQEGLKRLPATVTGQQIEAEIHSEAKYTWFLLLGTRRMRPRDFVSAALINRETDVEKILESYWFSLHDGRKQSGNSIHTTLIPHEERPAQLPGKR